MRSLIETRTQRTERVFLVGVELKLHKGGTTRETLDELAELVETAGGTVLGEGVQKMDTPNAGTYIGKGKAEEFAAWSKANQVDTIIFDDELTPAQSRNLEKIFECKVLDRTALILDIFAQRARTREGKLQIELAQLEHLLPRLTRYWTHLSRQKGGIGMRGGEGESQLESDRRRIQERIDKIREELDTVGRQRTTQRQGRQRNLWPLASIVGYTNAGKSTLLNRLTGAGVLAEDKLFATLDPTTRKHRLPNNQNILLSDTVGFLRKLPHHLVESFKATLEETVLADLLLHVVDISHPQAKEQIKAVEVVLHEINAWDKPTILVLNKIDRLGTDPSKFPGGVAISAKHGTHLDQLQDEIANRLRERRVNVTLSIPAAKARAIALVYQAGYVTAREHDGGQVILRAQIPKVLAGELKPYVTETEE